MTNDTVVLQTCDGHAYKRMLDVTSVHNQKYAQMHGYDYVRFDGIKHGTYSYPWRATFNRIYMLEEARDQGYKYALYLDADAVVCQLARNIHDVIQADKLMTISTDSTLGNMNAGVFVMNLQHPKTDVLLNAWKAMYEVWDSDPEDGTHDPFRNDQQHLYDIFTRLLRNSQNTIHFDTKWDLQGTFTKQSLRHVRYPTITRTYEERICELQELIAKANHEYMSSQIYQPQITYSSI